MSEPSEVKCELLETIERIWADQASYGWSGDAVCVDDRFKDAVKYEIEAWLRDTVGPLVEALPKLQRAIEIDLSHAQDAVARGEMQQKRMPYDHDNNDALERNRKWLADAEKARAALQRFREGSK